MFDSVGSIVVTLATTAAPASESIAKTALTAAAVAISIISLFISLREKERERRQSVVRALQGEREAVAFVAYRLHQNPDSLHADTADQVVAALCLAWMFESSDRARAIVLAALRALRPSQAARIDQAMDDLQNIAANYAATPDADISKGVLRLKQLRTALGDNVGA